MSDGRLNGRSKEFVWHQRFSHLNNKSLHILAQQLVDDFDYNTSKQISFCKSCMEGKLHKPHFQVKAELWRTQSFPRCQDSTGLQSWYHLDRVTNIH